MVWGGKGLQAQPGTIQLGSPLRACWQQRRVGAGPWLLVPATAPPQPQPLPRLQEYCRERLGESQSRLRCYSFEEVKALNAEGGCWLILDDMVLDVSMAGSGGQGRLWIMLLVSRVGQARGRAHSRIRHAPPRPHFPAGHSLAARAPRRQPHHPRPVTQPGLQVQPASRAASMCVACAGLACRPTQR